ncbi:MAG: DUF1993 domain-containing protein [Lysobacter sp.]|nr:DUF1993 domain-containing protein [Lysobacter sp.]
MEYQSCVPVFIRSLRNLAHVLRKGEAHANARNITPEVLLQTRLIPDMLPLVAQVQIATDLAKNGASRLAGIDPPKFDNDETNLAQLFNRIDRAIAHLESLTAEQIDGSEARPITLNMPDGSVLDFDGRSYLLSFALPNLYFHSTMTYAILRQAGVVLGKRDFLSGDALS